MVGLWLGNIPADLTAKQIVTYLMHTYHVPKPLTVRVNSNADARRRNEKFCVIDFDRQVDAMCVLSRSRQMWWPNGHYILVRDAWDRHGARKTTGGHRWAHWHNQRSQWKTHRQNRDLKCSTRRQCRCQDDRWWHHSDKRPQSDSGGGTDSWSMDGDGWYHRNNWN